MNNINGGIISATDVRKSWKNIVDQVVTEKIPVYVFAYNSPTVVIIGYEEYNDMKKKLSDYQRN